MATADTWTTRFRSRTATLLVAGWVSSICLCIVGVGYAYPIKIPWYHVLLAIFLALPIAIIGIRSLAESDYNPQSGLVSQLVFSAIISRSDANAIVINIMSAGLAQAGASQAGDVAYDFKVGDFVGAPPESQLYGQMIGSVFGAFVSLAAYRLYTSSFAIPGPVFEIPASFLDVSTAKLFLGRGLPEGVSIFAAACAAIFTPITITKMIYARHRWEQLLPSGISFAIGIMNVPSFTLSRVFGGLIYWACTRCLRLNRHLVIFAASGLVLGESISSVAISSLQLLSLAKT